MIKAVQTQAEVNLVFDVYVTGYHVHYSVDCLTYSIVEDEHGVYVSLQFRHPCNIVKTCNERFTL